MILLFRDFSLSWSFFSLASGWILIKLLQQILSTHLKNDKEIIAWEDLPMVFTAQKMKFSIKDFFSKLRIWSHLLKKSLMENFHFLCGAWGTKRTFGTAPNCLHYVKQNHDLFQRQCVKVKDSVCIGLVRWKTFKVDYTFLLLNIKDWLIHSIISFSKLLEANGFPWF